MKIDPEFVGQFLHGRQFVSLDKHSSDDQPGELLTDLTG
jgi:hypothetical protein